MRTKLLTLLCLLALLASAACAPTTPAAEPTSVPVEATATTPPEPTEVPAEAPAASAPEPRELVVLAAASLTESFSEIGKRFEAHNEGVSVIFSFAGSQQLAQQLEQGAPADVFASASKKYMDAAVESKRVADGAAQTFAKNRLVVVFPAANPGGITGLKDLTKPGLKLDLAAKEVPVGQYSLDFLDKATADPAFGATFKDDVLKNVVSYEDNVKAVLTKVVLGEADAGIVYSSDITADVADQVARLDIPDELNVIANYPIAPILDSTNAELAQNFVDFILSPDGQAILEKYNFISGVSPAASTTSAGPITLTDALGREVKFEKVPERIVLSGKALFMIADAIYLFPEAGQRIAAIGSTKQGSGNFIPMIDSTFQDKTLLESDAGPEQIAAVQPDCVILKSSAAEKLGKPIEALGIPVVYVDFETPEQYERDLATLGQLFQNTARAEQIAAFYDSSVESVTSAVAGVAEDAKPSVLLLYYSDKDGAVAFNVPPMSWMQTQMVELAGGTPVWADANPADGWTKVGLEQVAAWDPDYVFVVTYATPNADAMAALKADPQWQALRATQENHLYGFATDVYSWDQPDTRWILGLTWLAGKLHPDLFPNLDITATAQQFYEEMYGMDAASFEANIVPLFTADLP